MVTRTILSLILVLLPATLWAQGPAAKANASRIDDISQKHQALDTEVDEVKKSLIDAGLVEPFGQRPLTAEELKQRESLEQQLEEVQKRLDNLNSAIEGGLDPDVVQVSLDEHAATKKRLEEEIAAIGRDEGGTRWEAIQQEVADLNAKVARLEKDNAELKSAPASRTIDDDGKPPALPLEIYAFGDFYFSIIEGGPDDFNIGQLELDVEMPLHDSLTIMAAVAYDGDSGAFGVGAFTIDGRIMGSDDSHFFQSKKIETMGITLGQFDVPFGIAYMEYASIDNRFVTGSLAVAESHDGWNDLGGQFYLDANYVNFIAWGVNGYGPETTFGLGGRVGIAPAEWVEVGGSFSSNLNKDAKADIILAGGDMAVEAAGLTIKGEYIFHREGIVSKDISTKHGMYGQAMYDFDPVYIIGRYSTVKPGKDPWLKQLSAGIGVAVFENAEIRFEYSTDLEDGGNMAFIQLAGGMGWAPTGFRR